MPNKGITSLPLSRIKTIMKTCPESVNIGQDALILVTEAAELIIRHIAVESYENSSNKKHLDYKAVAEYVNTEERFDFVQDIIPPKIKLSDYVGIINEVEEQERKNTDFI